MTPELYLRGNVNNRVERRTKSTRSLKKRGKLRQSFGSIGFLLSDGSFVVVCAFAVFLFCVSTTVSWFDQGNFHISPRFSSRSSFVQHWPQCECIPAVLPHTHSHLRTKQDVGYSYFCPLNFCKFYFGVLSAGINWSLRTTVPKQNDCITKVAKQSILNQ